jgi:hypothetical protein
MKTVIKKKQINVIIILARIKCFRTLNNRVLIILISLLNCREFLFMQFSNIK